MPEKMGMNNGLPYNLSSKQNTKHMKTLAETNSNIFIIKFFPMIVFEERMAKV